MKVINYILNGKWTEKDFERLDLSKYTQSEIDLFKICKHLKIHNLEINAQNIFRNGNKENLLLYITLQNKIDLEKLKRK